ncbi:hypothetical protein HO542_00980 [Streptococcus suis]|nr:hypothetical protein [Streptococcus suis]MBY4970281.1 hypothetical protein [Streptococcus suis]MBY5016758.1 hypothetical protein [Streptococcus suis]NQJ69941.1 hypothetical protein [Streptococcus suis]NQJ73308.1 hypothetical protein [Streptococcus suis]NRG69501.1 hypothetical protein [Streptococcus suis]
MRNYHFFMKTESNKNVFRSAIFGRGLYQWLKGETVLYPYDENLELPVLTNILTGERFYIRFFQGSYMKVLRLKYYIQHPNTTGQMVFPVDIVDIPYDGEDIKVYKDSRLNYHYEDSNFNIENDNNLYGIVFPLEHLHGRKRQTLKSWLQEKKFVASNSGIYLNGWTNPELRQVILHLLSSVIALNLSGYLLGDIHLSRILLDDELNVQFEFTDLLYMNDEMENSGEFVEPIAPKKGEYPLEFAEPAYIRGRVERLDVQSQNYSITALLFYLLFSHYPYADSYRTINDDEEDLIRYYSSMYRYFENPIFVFEDSESTRFGILEDEQHVIHMWGEVGKQAQEMFLSALSKAKAERLEDYCAPNPSMWLDFLSMG